jgi:hypothetical protein
VTVEAAAGAIATVADAAAIVAAAMAATGGDAAGTAVTVEAAAAIAAGAKAATEAGAMAAIAAATGGGVATTSPNSPPARSRRLTDRAPSHRNVHSDPRPVAAGFRLRASRGTTLARSAPAFQPVRDRSDRR